jgi:hypothetical protein
MCGDPVKAPVTGYKAWVRYAAILFVLVIGFGSLGAGTATAAVATAYDFPAIDPGGSNTRWTAPNGTKWVVDPASGGTSWMRDPATYRKLNASNFARPAINAGSMKTELPQTKFDAKFAEIMKNEKIGSGNVIVETPKDLGFRDTLKSTDGTAGGGAMSSVGSFIKGFFIFEGLKIITQGAPVAITCGAAALGGQNCLDSADPINHALEMTYPFENLFGNAKKSSWWGPSGETRDYLATPGVPDARGNVHIEEVLLEPQFFDPDSASADMLYLPMRWDGPDLSYPHQPNPQSKLWYEAQCTYKDGPRQGESEWYTTKHVTDHRQGWWWNTGQIGSYESIPVTSCHGDGSGAMKVTGVRTFVDAYDEQGNIVNADETNKHRPQNTIAWSADMVNEDGSASAATTEYIVEQECVDAMGNTRKISASSYGDQNKLVVPSCAQNNAGLSKKTSVYGDVGQGPVPIMERTPGPETEQMPDCGTAQVAMTNSPCTLQIRLDNQPCVSGSAVCENWAEIARSNPERVQCTYANGGYSGSMFLTLPMANCNALERSYGLRPGQQNGLNTDGNPETGGQNYWEDALGNPVPRPTNGLENGTGGNMFELPSREEFPDCVGGGLANLATFVLNIGGCILKQAFQPDPVNLQNNLDALRATSADTPVGRLGESMILNANSFGAALAGQPGDAGCKGPPLHLVITGIHLDETYYLLSACEEPIKTVAATMNMLISISFVLAGGFSIARAYALSFGYDLKLGKGFSEMK